mmetsp:Transcript_25270/g.59153  ORF Transcript_25270/g.59153 Transcript_25270/m.59153 type:complete len:921 (+) Transcript_25270:99-2861(+)
MAIVSETALDSSCIEQSLKVSNEGPVDVTNHQHLLRNRLLRGRPGESCNAPISHCHANMSGNMKDELKEPPDVRLRLRLREQQRERAFKAQQQQQRAQEKPALQNSTWKQDLPIHNNYNIDGEDRSCFPLCGGLDVIREETDTDEDVEPSTQLDQHPITYTKSSHTAAVIMDYFREDPTVAAGITANKSTMPPYNPNEYHFTNLIDGTPVYSSLSPFCSMPIHDFQTINYIDKEDDMKDDASSLTHPQSSSPSQVSAHSLDVNLEGVLYVGRSSIGPLVQSSRMVGSIENCKDEATSEESKSNQYYDRKVQQQDFHRNDLYTTMPECDNIVDHDSYDSFSSSSTDSAAMSDGDGSSSVDDTDFTSSSIDSLSSSISSIAINASNDNVNDSDTLRCKKKRKAERNSTSGQKKRYSIDDADIEDSVLKEDTRESRNKESNIIQFKDIIGHQSVKLRLDEVLLPMALPASLSQTILRGIRTLPASILLYGPPGCGKTQLAKAVAGEAHAAFLSIGPSDILSKYVGESEGALRSVFAEAVRLARINRGGSKCTVLFFDEIDALGQSRGVSSDHNGTFGRGGAGGPADMRTGEGDKSGSGDNSSRRILAELLIQLTKVNAAHGTYREDCDEEDKTNEISSLYMQEEKNDEDCIYSDNSMICQNKIMKKDIKVKCQHDKSAIDSVDTDGCNVKVIVVAATNRPNDCDPALIRRFAVQVKVGLPTAKDRRKMLKRSMEGIEHTITQKQFFELASITEGWSGSDLQSLAREAAMAPVRECIRRAALLKRQMFISQSHQAGEKNDDITVQMSSEEKRKKRSRRKHNVYASDFTGPQKRLLEEFRDLRPVNFRDFKKALILWFSRLYNNLNDSPLAEFGWIEHGRDANGIGALNEHYDSSSDEDAEEVPFTTEKDQKEVRDDSGGCDIVI